MKHAIDAPAPGKIPTRLPIIHERPIVGAISFNSCFVSIILSLNCVALARAFIFASAKINAWLIENKPINAHVTFIPSYNEL